MDLEKNFKTLKRVFAKIDLDAVCDNARRMMAGLPAETGMIAVLKTDGYGHGSVPIAECLEPMDFLRAFAVAAPEEAYILRENGIRKPILILGYSFPDTYERMAKEGICATVFTKEALPELAEAAKTAGKPLKVHVKVDTGMGRIGITPDEEGLAFIRLLSDYVREGSLEAEGIFTHFACADERDKTDAGKQLACFAEFLKRAEAELGLRIPVRHCANSAAILEMPEASMDAVRAGIALYGLRPSQEVPGGSYELKPTLSLHSHIVYVKTVHPGQRISYGGTFTAQHTMRVATIPVGYGDGYPRSLSGGKGYVLIRGSKAPILGRVCMDQFMVDVSHIPGAAQGDPVTLIGEDGGKRISVEELGALSGRFNYEFVCNLGMRVPRVFYRDGEIVAIQDLEGIHRAD